MEGRKEGGRLDGLRRRAFWVLWERLWTSEDGSLDFSLGGDA